MSKRRTYSKQFKLDVMQQSYQWDNIREPADELGIDPGLIYAWRSRYKSRPKQPFPGKGIPSQTPEQKQLAELKKELADVRMERDILKKAMGIFSSRRGHECPADHCCSLPAGDRPTNPRSGFVVPL